MCSVLSLGRLQVSEIGPFEKMLAILTVIYCHKGLHAMCFQDSVIHL